MSPGPARPAQGRVGAGVGEIEQHTEEVGWLHHIWDEVGPQITLGIMTVIGLALAAYITVWAKHKFTSKR